MIGDDGSYWQMFTARTMIMMNIGDEDRDQQPDDPGSEDSNVSVKPDVALFLTDVGGRTLIDEFPYLSQSMELTGVRRSPNSIKGTLELEGNFFGESEATLQGTVCGVDLHNAILRLTGFKPGQEEALGPEPDDEATDQDDGREGE
jgi:hypothetical protein